MSCFKTHFEDTKDSRYLQVKMKWNAESGVRLASALKIFSRLDGRFIELAGVTVLAGWTIENEVLMRVTPEFVVSAGTQNQPGMADECGSSISRPGSYYLAAATC